MNPQRRVRRSQNRPVYNRRPSSVRQRGRGAPQLQLPVIKVVWLKLGLVVVAVVILLIVMAHLTRLQKIVIQGNHSLTTQHITNLTETAVHSQLLGTNMVLMNTGAIAHSLEAADAGIGQASVHRKLFHTLVVQITERQPTLNWQTEGADYIIDASGAVIGPTKGAYTKLPVVIDSTNLPVKVGDRVAPMSFVTFCNQLVHLLPAAGYTVVNLTVPESTNEVYVKTSTGLTLKFDTTRPAGDEIADLEAVTSELSKANKTPTQYIDVRIPHKAYYL